MQLRNASRILSKRGLKLASKWASEQLIGLPKTHHHHYVQHQQQSAEDVKHNSKYKYLEMEDEENMSDLELFAQSLFDLGEYRRAGDILSDSGIHSHEQLKFGEHHHSNNPTASIFPSSSASKRTAIAASACGDLVADPPLPSLTNRGIFLRAYSLYLAGERTKEEQVIEIQEPLEKMTVQNQNLPQLAVELHNYHQTNRLDAFGLYIYGVILKELQKMPTNKSTMPYTPTIIEGIHTPSAQSILIQSLIQYPYNWSAWLDLAELCIGDPTIHPQVESKLKPISQHWMYHFFCVHIFLENQDNENALIVMDRLMNGTHATQTTTTTTTTGTTLNNQFPNGFFINSPYLQSQLAVGHYNMRNFDAAQDNFVNITQTDPHRLDHMDVYSNILYVKEDKVALSQLAHRATRIDKYRPETCCIVGNYYSLKSQHEKAVQYFQRALKLDRSYLSAWTLMGHEYLEMKNTAAAVEAYRRAVDINPRDYRAWYGLGQTYEIMNMLLYALYYFRKVVELRPYDARMWCALGGCYLGLERREDAIRSYERAVSNNDIEGFATKKLAALYKEDGDSERAAKCYLQHLELRYRAQDSPTIALDNMGQLPLEHIINSVHIDAPEAEALLYLAYYHRDHGVLDMAAMCCSRLQEYPGPEKEEGKALLREIRSRMDAMGTEPKKDSIDPTGMGVHRSESGGKVEVNNDSFEFSP
mmetsp:Transcript_2981/g.4189  ORF Transcript_2981/g.4189 Transcript_2981/m.4189 type:complete len:700 (+) Transcript_2981:3-2102(+)